MMNLGDAFFSPHGFPATAVPTMPVAALWETGRENSPFVPYVVCLAENNEVLRFVGDREKTATRT